LILAVGVAALLVAISILAGKEDEVGKRREVFEQAWRVVGEKYFDRTMNGLDWNGVRERYEKKLNDAENTTDLYWKVLRPMLALLESSHVIAISPADAKGYPLDGLPRASMPASNIESCGGLITSFSQRSILPRVASVDADSYLQRRGVRDGWRFLGWSPSKDDADEKLTLDFMSPTGEEVSVAMWEPDKKPVDAGALKKDFESLGILRTKGADPATELRLESIGISLRIGSFASLPVVIDILKGSEAELAGIEPGSMITSFHRHNGVDGVFDVNAKLTSPNGTNYAASFKFRMCDVPDREAVLLPGNILFLRFNSFQADVTPWLDAQLSVHPRAVVLDLRRNGGGNATAMLEILSRFFDAGTRISEAKDSEESRIMTTGTAPYVFKGRLAVLIGLLSASASEVSANAVRFYKRGILYGRKTQGDVLLSRSFLLADGGIIQVATADMRGPDGQRLENVGVRPDFEIMPTLETVRAGRDVVLEAALADLTQPTH
jgi:C-terminal processing protease CtpA/Prc